MLNRIPLFKSAEIEVALELIDTVLNIPSQTDYHLYVMEIEEKVIGYHCTGLRPLTDGVYDLYWIVVDPDNAGKGAGSILLAHAEQLAASKHARWLLAETSLKAQYQQTRDFYVKNNYAVLCEIPHFYTMNDGLIIFGKSFLTT
jgi:aminoglycoside 6'-N-acetyltransferase I